MTIDFDLVIRALAGDYDFHGISEFTQRLLDYRKSLEISDTILTKVEDKFIVVESDTVSIYKTDPTDFKPVCYVKTEDDFFKTEPTNIELYQAGYYLYTYKEGLMNYYKNKSNLIIVEDFTNINELILDLIDLNIDFNIEIYSKKDKAFLDFATVDDSDILFYGILTCNDEEYSCSLDVNELKSDIKYNERNQLPVKVHTTESFEVMEVICSTSHLNKINKCFDLVTTFDKASEVGVDMATRYLDPAIMYKKNLIMSGGATINNIVARLSDTAVLNELIIKTPHTDEVEHIYMVTQYYMDTNEYTQKGILGGRMLSTWRDGESFVGKCFALMDFYRPGEKIIRLFADDIMMLDEKPQHSDLSVPLTSRYMVVKGDTAHVYKFLSSDRNSLVEIDLAEDEEILLNFDTNVRFTTGREPSIIAERSVHRLYLKSKYNSEEEVNEF